MVSERRSVRVIGRLRAAAAYSHHAESSVLLGSGLAERFPSGGVLGAILHEADPYTVLRNLAALAEASTSVVTTDTPQATSLPLVPPPDRARGPGFAIIDALALRVVALAEGEQAATPVRLSSAYE
jgi:hypothetical protein